MSTGLRSVLEKHFKVLGEAGGEITMVCPFSDCTDQKGHFGINTVKGKYHCWICDRGGNVDKLLKIFGIDFAYSRESEQKRVDKQEVEMRLPRGYRRLKPYDKPEGDDDLMAMMYLYGRGVTASMIESIDVGVSDEEGCYGKIVVPCYNVYDELIYWFARRYMPGEGTRYKNIKAPRGKVMWGMDRFWKSGNDTLVLCEGFFDAVKDSRCVALLASSLTVDQIRFIRSLSIESVVIALDKEEEVKSRAMAYDLVKSGIPMKKIRVVKFQNDDPKDFGDMCRKLIDKRIRESVKFSEYVTRM